MPYEQDEVTRIIQDDLNERIYAEMQNWTVSDLREWILSETTTTATSLSMDNHIPIILFALKDPVNILRVVMGEKIGTVVKEDK